MKKRAKIITTIASLCLAVALLAFGVYAATTATVAVTSSITFTCKDVFADIEITVYTSDDGTANSDNTTQVGHVTQKTYSGTGAAGNPYVAGYRNDEWDMGELMGNNTYTLTSASPYIRIVVTVAYVTGPSFEVPSWDNTDYDDANIELDKYICMDTATGDEDDSDTYWTNFGSNVEVGGTAETSSVTFIYVAHVVNPAVAQSTLDISLDFTIGYYTG